MIGCTCDVCISKDTRDQRLRSSILLTEDATNILVDTGPDLRQQMLQAKVGHLDAIFITHEHNDHVIGLDDIRPFNFISGRAMHFYAEKRVKEELLKRFEYVFGEPIPGLPRIELHEIGSDSTIDIKGLNVQAIRIMHGRLPILAFRFGDLAYITDMLTIPESEIKKLKGVKTLVVNALRKQAHHSHMTLEQALDFIKIIQPERAYLTHISHWLGKHEDVSGELPPHVQLAYDGLVLDC